MKAFKVHNAEEVKQEVNLPAGTYTYSCRVIPVGTSYTFRLDNQSFTFEGLTAGILNKRMKHTFELTEAVSFFYLSDTVGDCVFEPQIEEGVFATTPGAHPLDFERLISEAGIEIDHEALSLYAKKADVSAEIKIQTDRIDSTVGNISNDVDGVKGDITTISQTVNSITSTVTNHTTQISTFQQTVNQIYASIEDVGSGEFSHILQRIDQIEMKVGAPGQNGSIQVALDSIASTVYDENEGMSAINQKVNSITSTVYDEHGALLSQISQDGSNVKITASQIDLRGYFTAGNYFRVSTDGKLEATDAVLHSVEVAGGFKAQGWGVVPEMRVNIQSDFPSYQPGYTVGNIVVHGGYKLHMNRNNYETKYKITLDNRRDDNYRGEQYNNINTMEVSPERIYIRREYNEASPYGVLRKISAEINVDEYSNHLAIRLVGLPSSPVSGCVYRDSNGYLRMGL